MVRDKRLYWGIVAVFIVCVVFFYRKPSTVLNRTPCTGCVNELNARVIASWSRGGHITQLAWSPSGKFLADGSSWNRDIEILETDRWSRVGNIRRSAGSPETYKMIAFTDDEHLIAPTGDSRSDNQNVVLNKWDIYTGKATGSFITPIAGRTLMTNIARNLSVNSRKKVVVAISEEILGEPAPLYETDNQTLLKTFSTQNGRPRFVELSQNGDLLSLSTVGGEILIYREDSGALINIIHASDHPFGLLGTVDFSFDSQFIAAGLLYGTVSVLQPNGTLTHMKIDDPIRIWRVKDGQMVHTIKGDFGDISQLSWSPDGKLLAALTGNRELRIWETTQFRLVLRPVSTPWHYAIGFKPDGTQLAIATGSSIKVLSIDDSKLASLEQ